MKACARIVLALLAFALCATTAQAATPTQNADLDRLVDAVVAYYHLPGIAVGVIDDGEVVYTHRVARSHPANPSMPTRCSRSHPTARP